MDAGGGSQVRLIQRKITSIAQLEADEGPYTAVIVAAGAANELIAEIGKLFFLPSLPFHMRPTIGELTDLISLLNSLLHVQH